MVQQMLSSVTPDRSASGGYQRVIGLFTGVLLLGMAAPELGFLPWTPVRGDANPALESEQRIQARFTPVNNVPAAAFATPWIVPDPPPIASELTANAGAPNRISLRASNITWVTVCADGRNVIERLFEAGSTAEVAFEHQMTLRSGNAGALEIEMQGHLKETMGPWGAIRMIHATPAGYQFVAPVITSGCDAS